MAFLEDYLSAPAMVIGPYPLAAGANAGGPPAFLEPPDGTERELTDAEHRERGDRMSKWMRESAKFSEWLREYRRQQAKYDEAE